MKKHLSLSERKRIEKLLNERNSFKAIGRLLQRDCTTISKEVKNHVYFKKSGCFGQAFNNCRLRFDCTLSSLCEKENCRHKKCKCCSVCYLHCKYYEKATCTEVDKAPYVCNGCLKRSGCTLEKTLYSASYAQHEYELVRSESRSGISVSEEEVARLDSVISPLLLKGQSIHHICTTNLDQVMFSEKTIYNYVDAGLFAAKNLDLPRKVKCRPRKSRHDSFKVDRKCRIGRTYEDYLNYLKDQADVPIVQLDSVEGRRGGKVLLTIHFVESQFMLAFLRDANDSKSVIGIFERLYIELRPDIFMNLFQVCLADNGSEFSNPNAIEFDQQGNRRTRVFYCDPSSPFQKGAAENNHEFIRRILPKGSSFDDLTQEKVDVMMNHINSYKRKKLGDLSPYEMFKTFYGRKTLEKLGATLISPNDIHLLPALLK
ncbi:MAG TPA: IS30 family transposase [Candidatus Pelethocola excrementipullorum]|nr:IS30 family transposase [Candidatus Pelethocola excrementipullorum]